MTKQIELTQGLSATVDAEDFDALNQFTWHAVKHKRSFYAAHWLREGSSRRKEYMHIRIMGYHEGMEIDHRDGIGINNSRDNLRIATSGQNSQNRRIDCRNKTGVTGVTWNKRMQAWRVFVGRKYIGKFTEFTGAVTARLLAAKQIFGEFSPSEQSA